MSIFTIPQVKKCQESEGTFSAECLRIFAVGGGETFARTLKALMPQIKAEAAEREEANVILTVAGIFSPKPEYCAIRIRPELMEIRCRDEEGARNAACLLVQLMKEGKLPCGDIADWPDTACRAMMLESSGRSWLSMERILLYIRQMALARMNELHFHFMEAPGCTIQLDCFPEMHGFGPENLKYTKEEIRNMVAYAAELGITVTPFVEVLSHSFVFNKAADIACPGDPDEQMFAVCVGQEKTYDAIEALLTEVAELFPAPILHIGGDEYDMSAVSPRTVHWQECPHCRALSKQMGYTTNRELFLYALERVNRIVNRLGKVAMVWNADLKPGEIPDLLERNMVIHYYRNDNPLSGEKIYDLSIDGYIRDGFAVLNSNFRSTYLDKYVSTERLSSWGCTRDPYVTEKEGVAGGCCCAWEEHSHFDYTISPAIFLFADRLWHSEGAATLYDRTFALRLTELLFDGLLPADMNVFDAVGDVLPPVDPAKDQYFHKLRLNASPDELERILNALQSIDHPLATPYAEVTAAALKHRQAQSNKPKTATISFDG
ncbi:MAG: family 20 glycosylhydrolase [Clostridia bacterium]|nr:family 20 glycosylhydrolase [Clostridia bacterium]